MPLTVGHVIRRTWDGVRKNAGPILGVIAVFMLPGATIAGVVGHMYNPLAIDPSNVGPFLAATWGMSVISLIFYAIAHAAALFVALDWLGGGTPSFGSAAQRAVARIVAIVVTSILVYLAFGFGFLLCFVPGFIALAGFSLAIPALLAEQLGPIAAMRRSWELTKGHRLVILAVFMVVGVATAIISTVLQVAMAGNIFADPMTPYRVSLTTWTVQQILGYIIGVFVSAVFAVLAAVLFSEIRGRKEGVDVESVATVFQ